MPDEIDLPIVTSKTPIKLTIGMLVLLAGNIVTVVTEHVTTRKDVEAAKADLQELRQHIVKQQEIIYTLRLDQARMKQNIDDFLNTYDRDFNRYIRDKADRPSRDRLRASEPREAGPADQ